MTRLSLLSPFRILSVLLASLLLTSAFAIAQDALNLPAPLFVLLNSGVLQRYGLGAEGVRDVTPADTFVVDFGVAPDGDQIAYRTETSINVISLANRIEPRIIEREADVPPYRGRGETIAWSPDGTAIAYTTTYGARVFIDLGGVAAYADLREGLFVDLLWSPDSRFLSAQTDAGVWWIYRREAITFTLASVIPTANGVTWVSGGQIVFAAPEGGLTLMDLDLANTQSPILDATWDYYLPYLNAADELVFFAREKTDEATPPAYGRLQSIARGAAEIVTRSDTPVLTTGLRWAPGAALLIAFDGGVIVLFDPVTGQGFPLPARDAVAYSWGGFDPNAFFTPQTPAAIIEPTAIPAADAPTQTAITAVAGVALPYDGYFLAYGEFDVPQLWRLPASGDPATPLTAIPSAVSEYAVAPDLSSIVYVSDGQLWLLTLATGRSVPLATLEGVGFVTPAFSPDRQQIAYADGGIRLVSVVGGDARVVLADTAEGAEQPSFYGEPQFSPDGAQLLISELRPGSNGVHGVLTIADSTYRVLQTDFGARALWLSDGSIISFGYTPMTAPSAQQAIVRFPPGSTDAAEPVYEIDSTARIETITESVLGEIRLITQAQDGITTMLDVAYATQQQASITQLPVIFAPQLSYDGGFIAGYINQSEINGIRQGPLTIYNANSGVQVLLGSPSSVWQFQWGR
jgi:hypothetical protein